MPKLPFMKFYPSDFLMDLQTQNLESRGALITILCHIWHKSETGTVVLTDKELSVLWGVGKEKFIEILSSLNVSRIIDYSFRKSNRETGLGLHKITSRRISKDKKSLELNAKHQYMYKDRVRLESEKNKSKVSRKKSEVRSQKSEKDLKTNTALVPKATPPHVKFVEDFKKSYEVMTQQPFKFEKAQFVIAQRLIKEYGIDAVVVKAKILGNLCRNESAWFTKDGWASFTIQKLSSMWNSIIPGSMKTEEQKKSDSFEKERKRQEDLNEQVKHILSGK